MAQFWENLNIAQNVDRQLIGVNNMYEYINRTDAIEEINRGDLLVGNNAEWAREIIWRTPYSDVAPVRRGYWIAVKMPTGVEAFCSC